MMDRITVAVDADVAEAYRGVSARDRRKLDLLVNLRLRDATRSSQSLRDTMEEISRSAQQRGLTPEDLGDPFSMSDDPVCIGHQRPRQRPALPRFHTRPCIPPGARQRDDSDFCRVPDRMGRNTTQVPTACTTAIAVATLSITGLAAPPAGPLAAQEVIELPAEDRPLDAEFEEIYRLGSVDGGGWDMFGSVTGLGFDGAGNLYIPDTQAMRISVVDPEGQSGAPVHRGGGGPR